MTKTLFAVLLLCACTYGQLPTQTTGGGGSSGGGTWGTITGTLSTQTDLATALNGKQATLGNSTWGSVLYTTGANTVAEDTTLRWFTNRTKLYRWGMNLGKFRNGTLSGPLTILLIGDSRTANESWSAQFRNVLQAKYGDAGIGYVSLTGNPQTQTGVTRTCSGNGGEINQNLFGFGPALDMLGMGSTSSCSITARGTDYVIFYATGNGNGTFQWRLDGGSWTSVSTNAGTTTFQSVTIATGGAAASHTVDIQTVSTGSSGQLWVMGVDVQINGVTGGGVRVHRLGSSGAMTSHWVSPNATVWQGGIAKLGGHIALISLGTNEHINSVAASTQSTNLTTLVSRLRSAIANIDVVLSSPADDGWTTSTTIAQYEQAQHSLAVSSGYGWIDQYPMVGPYATNTSLFFSDQSHYNTDAGGIVSLLTTNYLFGLL